MVDAVFKKLKLYFYSSVKILMLVLFSLITYYTITFKAWASISDIREWMMFGTPKIVLFSLALIPLFLLFLYFVTSILPSLLWNKKKEAIIVCIFFVLCVFSSYYFANESNGEIAVVNETAKLISMGAGFDLDNDSMEFLSHYSYLRSLILYGAIWYKLGGKIFASLVVCIGMTVSFWESLQMIKLFKGNDSSLWICSAFYYMSVPIYLSSSIFYNYSVVFWMPITLLYLYLLYTNAIEKKKQRVYFWLIIIIASLGTSIFSIVAVPVIAIIIDMILNKKKKVLLLVILVLLGTFICSNVSDNIVGNSVFNSEERQALVDKNKMPMTLSTMYVGLNRDSLGLFNMDDYIYITSFESYEEKKDGLLPAVMERLQVESGFLDFVLKKSSVNFGQGTFYTEFVSNVGLINERAIIRYLSKDFGSVRFYCGFFCAMNIIFLILMLWLIIKKCNRFNLLFLTIFGVWMVSMISESDSRHIFPYLPLFIVMASYSASLIGGNCLERLKRKRIHHKQKSA